MVWDVLSCNGYTNTNCARPFGAWVIFGVCAVPIICVSVPTVLVVFGFFFIVDETFVSLVFVFVFLIVILAFGIIVVISTVDRAVGVVVFSGFIER